MTGLMQGKRGLVMGVANDHSIAWGIAQTLAAHGAELAFTYQGDVFKKRVVPLVTPLDPTAVLDCDVTSQGSLEGTFAELKKVWYPSSFFCATRLRSLEGVSVILEHFYCGSIAHG